MNYFKNCVSTSDVKITSCKGTCGESYEESKISWVDGDLIMKNGDCKCCKGKEGRWKTYEVKIWCPCCI